MQKTIEQWLNEYRASENNPSRFNSLVASSWYAYSCSDMQIDCYQTQMYEILKDITNPFLLHHCSTSFAYLPDTKNAHKKHLSIYIKNIDTDKIVYTILMEPDNEIVSLWVYCNKRLIAFKVRNKIDVIVKRLNIWTPSLISKLKKM